MSVVPGACCAEQSQYWGSKADDELDARIADSRRKISALAERVGADEVETSEAKIKEVLARMPADAEAIREIDQESADRLIAFAEKHRDRFGR